MIKNATITEKTWDEVQEAVRAYAAQHHLEVTPEDYLSVDDTRMAVSLELHRAPAVAPLASFFPEFSRDDVTVKQIAAVYQDNKGIEELLTEMKAKPRSFIYYPPLE